MYYQSMDAAKYRMADRAREAERARIAREVVRSRGPSAARKITTTVVSLLTLGLKH